MASGSAHWSPEGVGGSQSWVPLPRLGPTLLVASPKGLRTSRAGSGAGCYFLLAGLGPGEDRGEPAVPPTPAAGASARKERGRVEAEEGGLAECARSPRPRLPSWLLLSACFKIVTTAPLYGAWPCDGLFPSMTSLHQAHNKGERAFCSRGHRGSEKRSGWPPRSQS